MDSVVIVYGVVKEPWQITRIANRHQRTSLVEAIFMHLDQRAGKCPQPIREQDLPQRLFVLPPELGSWSSPRGPWRLNQSERSCLPIGQANTISMAVRPESSHSLKNHQTGYLSGSSSLRIISCAKERY